MWGNEYGYGPAMMGYGSGCGAGCEVVHAIVAIFWIVVLIAIIAAAVRALRGKPVWHCRGRMFGGDPALDLLRERYVKGEIDRKEFEEKKKDLSA